MVKSTQMRQLFRAARDFVPLLSLKRTTAHKLKEKTRGICSSLRSKGRQACSASDTPLDYCDLLDGKSDEEMAVR